MSETIGASALPIRVAEAALERVRIDGDLARLEQERGDA
jgi:hypothetical protein